MRYVLYHASWCPFCRAFLPIFRRTLPGSEEVLLDDEGDPLWTALNIPYVPTVIAYEGDKEVKRLRAVPGVGITEDTFRSFLG